MNTEKRGSRQKKEQKAAGCRMRPPVLPYFVFVFIRVYPCSSAAQFSLPRLDPVPGGDGAARLLAGRAVRAQRAGPAARFVLNAHLVSQGAHGVAEHRSLG